VLHLAVFYHLPQSLERRQGDNTFVPDELIAIREARSRVLASASPLASEVLDVEHALDRVLAEDVSAGGDVPPFACSAMDGYAVKPGPAGRALSVVAESRAGTPTARELAEGEAIRISTGAAVPAGAEAVIPQENVAVMDGRIETRAEIRPGEHIRGPGEDMRAGTRVLAAGMFLGPAELGAAVAAGAGRLRVSRRPRVRVLCTGDELRAPGEPLGPGEIHNSNGPMLVAYAQRCGAEVPPAVRLRDDRAATESALREALEQSDLVLISGGVSVGPHDHVKPALSSLGVSERFWGVSLQPGKPTWFGTAEEKLVFGLPGNPVSSVVTFSLFVRPALFALQGAAIDAGREAALGTAVRRNPRREQALRVRLEHRPGGVPVAVPNGPQGSHIVSSLVGADALAMIPPGEGELDAGTRVQLEPLIR
jgi:molybdopterin molybdotransferase